MADSSWDTYTPDSPRRPAWGWVLGALALTCFGIAAYFLLDRMNGEDDDGA